MDRALSVDLRERVGQHQPGAPISPLSSRRDQPRCFYGYVTKVLVPELAPGDIAIMDNLSSHEARPSATPSRPPTLSGCACCLTARTLTRSKGLSQNPTRNRAKLRSATFMTSGARSATSSTFTLPRNAPNTSQHTGMMQSDRKPL